RATGSLLHAWDANLHACVVRNGSGDLYSVVGADREPEEFVVGQFSAVQVLPTGLVGTNTKDIIVGMGFRLSLNPRSPQATVIFSGSGTGEADAVRAFEAIAKNPAQVLARQSNHFRSLLEDSTVITGPDDSFNAGFRWALAAMDRFVVETPHLGTAFAAGFGFSTSGWDGDQKVSGRPGYAWYFGRDSAWTSLAALESGNAEPVRSTLELLGRYQDLTGKILHELTTSGFAHYDSADATPLYVHLMGRYLAATGDLSFIRKEFPRLLKAMQFCSSTDTDGDLLIENTNVGHGWVEGGKLFPVHTEHYLASCWYAALHSAASVAAAVGKKTLASEWSGKAKLVRETILNTFWNPAREFYNFGKYADGTFNTEKTILPAVGMYLGIADQDKADACLSEYASANFTADWGTRIIGRDNLFFNPQGYHSGSVWPLFSGWNSLAEFQWNRPMQGYLHLMNNLLLYNQFAAGFIQEVLHGDVFQPAGVCPHQAWSESMVVQPTLEGMLGLLVDAPAHRITLRPYFPPSWNSAEVQNIIVGTTRVRVQMKRTGDTTRYTFKAERKERKHSKPEALRVTLQPAFPLGTRVKSVSIGSRRKKIERVIRRPYDVPPIEFDFIRDVEVSIQHSAGIALVPPVSSPTVGQSSKGPRIIAEEWKNGTYRLTVEVRPDTEYTFDLRDPDRMIRVVEGATLERRRNEYLEIRVAPDPQAAISGAYVRREIVVVT
ncbi:MAG TPA: amylo-alpha-1,6-glucosidase, partial [Bacteroidota bacterium]|nr:amylo-alpha-1,6-glucosidase [Bacteroidota bacterium]